MPDRPSKGAAAYRDEEAVDLFAGAGGWDTGARSMGVHPLGIEIDPAACATRAAAGLRTLQADIATLDPADFVGARGLIASPPCPTFSSGGTGGGRHIEDLLARCALEMAAGNDTRAATRDEAYEILRPITWAAEQAAAKKKRREPSRETADARARRDAQMSVLVVEPLRWALTLKPEWIALEQVPPVLGLWSLFAQILGAAPQTPYSTWTGILEAERYGVPQTRERAILVATTNGVAHPPRATHQRYDPKVPQLVEPEITLEGEILPWISMAEALGWGMTERPALTITAKPSERGGHREMGGGTGSRRRLNDERARGAWITDTGNTRGGTRTEGRTRSTAAPAPAITTRADQLEWRETPVALDSRAQRDGRTGKAVQARPVSAPAPTIAVQTSNNKWIFDRPATTISCDSRVWPPGHKKNADDERAGREGYGDRAGTGAVRVTVEEAAILQSFPPDYPWQGTRSQQFTQVGNAMPPLLAEAVLQAVAQPTECERAA